MLYLFLFFLTPYSQGDRYYIVKVANILHIYITRGIDDSLSMVTGACIVECHFYVVTAVTGNIVIFHRYQSLRLASGHSTIQAPVSMVT